MDSGERFARARNILLRTYDLTSATIALAFGFGVVGMADDFGPVLAGVLLVAMLGFVGLLQRLTRQGLNGTASLRDVVGTGVFGALLSLVMLAEPGWFMVVPFWAAVTALTLGSVRTIVIVCTAAAGYSALLLTVSAGDADWYMWPVTTLLLGLATGLSAFTYLSGKWLMDILREAEVAQESQARLAVTEERLRIARDLHDLLGHQLSLIAVKTELAIRVVPTDADRAQEELRDVQRSARSALREVRATIRGYRDPTLDTELAAIGGVLSAAGTICDIAAVPAELPAEQGTVLAWVVREAATNVLKHSHARRCSITLETTPAAVTLTMRNDGVAEAGADPGDGLAGLAGRVEAAGGRFTASAEGEDGFVVIAELPLGPVQSVA